jgi:hypothetical protein
MKTIAAMLCVVLGFAEPSLAYLKFNLRAGGRTVPVKWSGTIRYFVNQSSSVPGVSVGAFESTVARAFAAWEAVPTSSVRYEFGGLTAATPLDDDGRSTLGFLEKPEFDRVLGSTSVLVDDSTGEIVESDIFFNSAFAWSVAGTGEADRFDLESIAVHEIGHMSGLGHSALGETELRESGTRRKTSAESVMFPIAYLPGNVADRTLKADDIAGISDIYPDGGFEANTGTLSGHVTMGGRGVFGAHVVAFDPASGRMVAGFTLSQDGGFSLAGLSPGVYVVRVEPLDDADVDSFFGSQPFEIPLNFRVAFADRLAVVPRGGDSGAVDVTVVRK